MSDKIESQIERFAPGFRNTILARCVSGPAELERRNANLVGGDINGGAPTLAQLFFRPTHHLYSTPAPGLYICSSSPPQGAAYTECAAILPLSERCGICVSFSIQHGLASSL